MNRWVGRACPQRADLDVFQARGAARRDGLALPGSWAVCMGDYRFKPDSPALKLRIQAIDVSQAGIER
ncbi:MAG: hypothetical protein FJ398_27390 [Verrucomicrobia bacterium]|nr:hypothetical protein [Verrucomicrobiota bacterium]